MTPQELASYYAELFLVEGDCYPWEGSVSSEGYGVVHYEGRKWQAHRLTYMFSFGAVADGLDVAHKCDNKLCVNPFHLELVTGTKNVQDAFRRGLLPTRKGERNGRSKLTELDVIVIRDRYMREEVTRSELAREYGVSWPVIDGIIAGRSWKHL